MCSDWYYLIETIQTKSPILHGQDTEPGSKMFSINSENGQCPQYKNWLHRAIIQGVSLPTKPSSSLIILPLMRILQQNLKQTYVIV